MNDIEELKELIKEKNEEIKAYKVEPVYGAIEEVSIIAEVTENVD